MTSGYTGILITHSYRLEHVSLFQNKNLSFHFYVRKN